MISIYGKTDIGRIREENQDNFKIGTYEELSFVIVCDGMGGHNGGSIASKMSVDLISKYILENKESKDMDELLKESIKIANERIYSESLTNGYLYGMGTTVDLCIIKDDIAHIAHVGDGRVYKIHDGSITQVTSDHSMVEEMIKIGEITYEEAKTHPRKNIITRAVGTEENVIVDYISLSDFNSIFICTDGLVNYLDPERIKDIILNSENDEKAVSGCIKEANDLGGKDNITAVLIRK